MKEELSREITEIVTRYHRYVRGRKNEARDNLKAALFEKIRELVYFWPQFFFGLSEEDCAEFMLDFDGRIEGLIDSYDPMYNDFGAYIYPILEKSVKGYRREKMRRISREESLLIGCTAYEYLLNEAENSTENLVVSDVMSGYGFDTHVCIQRMYAIFAKCPITRERFYIYLLSHAREISTKVLFALCKTFYLDVEETQLIVKYIKSHQPRGREDVNHAIEKKNEYFGKRLILESELARRNYLSDHSMDQRIMSELERINYYYNRKAQYIRSQYTVSCRKIVSDMVHKNYGTVGTYLMFTCRLINWCKNPSDYRDFGLTEKSLAEITKTTDFTLITSQPLPMFSPIKAFRINIPLNC